MKPILPMAVLFSLLALPCCTTSVVTRRSSLDSPEIAYAIRKDEATRIVRAAVRGMLAEDYLIAEYADGTRWGAYDKESPAEHQLEIRVVKVTVDSPDHPRRTAYGFEVGGKGPIGKSGVPSKIYREITAGARRAGGAVAGGRMGPGEEERDGLRLRVARGGK